MNKKTYINQLKSDGYFQSLYKFFPTKFYNKFKWISIIYTVILFITTVIYLVIATYLNNNIFWYCLAIPIALLIFGSLVLTMINVNLCINKFKQNFYDYLNENNKPKVYLIINKKRLFSKGTNFVDDLIKQAYEQTKP